MNESTLDYWLFEIATASTFLSVFISLHQIFRHLITYNEPHIQLYIIRILMMIPVTIVLIDVLDLFHCHLALHSISSQCSDIQHPQGYVYYSLLIVLVMMGMLFTFSCNFWSIF